MTLLLKMFSENVSDSHNGVSCSTTEMILIDNNKINGTAEVICNNTGANTIKYFVADCAGPNPNMECSCCNLCCNDRNSTCNNLAWSVNMDPIWEYSYERQAYVFSNDLIASEP